MKLKFGKYKGEYIQDVPDAYLLWMYKNIDKKEIKKEALSEIVNRFESRAFEDDDFACQVGWMNGLFYKDDRE